MVTDGNGNACGHLGSPYINNCGYDTAGELLGFIYGGLNPPGDPSAGKLLEFDQTEFLPLEVIGMAPVGHVFVPAECQTTPGCRLHVAFHGCLQSQEVIGDAFYTQAGYNRWAATNRIIVLYPQVVASNPVPTQSGRLLGLVRLHGQPVRDQKWRADLGRQEDDCPAVGALMSGGGFWNGDSICDARMAIAVWGRWPLPSDLPERGAACDFRKARFAPLRGGLRPGLTEVAGGTLGNCRPGRRNDAQPNRETGLAMRQAGESCLWARWDLVGLPPQTARSSIAIPATFLRNNVQGFCRRILQVLLVGFWIMPCRAVKLYTVIVSPESGGRGLPQLLLKSGRLPVGFPRPATVG